MRYRAEVQTRAAADYSTHVSQLSSQIATLQISLHSILRLQNVVNDQRLPDEAETDDEEKSLLELLEVRRWKREFAAE